MEIVWGGASNPDDNFKMGAWCANQIWPGQGKTFDSFTTMGMIRKGNLVAVVVFHNWQPDNGVIEMSGASIDKRWLTRRTLHEMFSYCFDKAGCQLVVMRTSANSKVLNRIMKPYGFKSHRIPRLRGRHEDEIINTLTDDDWKNNKFEQNPFSRI